jgi:hypothetical protein
MLKGGFPDIDDIIQETRGLNLIQKIILLLDYFRSSSDRKFLEEKLVDFAIRMIEVNNRDPSLPELYFITRHLKYSAMFRGK